MIIIGIMLVRIQLMIIILNILEVIWMDMIMNMIAWGGYDYD